MTLFESYNIGLNILKSAGFNNPAFDSFCLFSHVYDINKHTYLINKNNPAESSFHNHFIDLINLRKAHYPLQYLIKTWEFMGLNFSVGKGVLIPRPDTEILVDSILNLLKINDNNSPRILDLCCGSGCIAVALKYFFPESQVTAVDCSDDALKFAHDNAAINKTNITFIKDDILKPTHKFNHSFDIIVSNPPYIASDVVKALEPEVLFEPLLALDGGADGLDFYRSIIKNYSKNLNHNGFLCFEIGFNQAMDVSLILKSFGFNNIKLLKDYNKNNRVLIAKKE